MAKMNLNQLAKDVADAEGGAQNLSIGQIKEVIRTTFLALQAHNPSAVLEAIERQQ